MCENLDFDFVIMTDEFLVMNDDKKTAVVMATTAVAVLLCS